MLVVHESSRGSVVFGCLTWLASALVSAVAPWLLSSEMDAVFAYTAGIVCFQIISFAVLLNVMDLWVAPEYPRCLLGYAPVEAFFASERGNVVARALVLGPMFSWWAALPAGLVIACAATVRADPLPTAAEICLWSLITQFIVAALLGLPVQCLRKPPPRASALEEEDCARWPDYRMVMERNGEAYALLLIVTIVWSIVLLAKI